VSFVTVSFGTFTKGDTVPTTGDDTIRQFFEKFEQSNAAGDAPAVAELFAPTFMSAGADGARVVTSTDLLAAIPRRKQMLGQIGWQSTALVALHETKLDDDYSAVNTEWRWRFARSGEVAHDITLPSTFIVHRPKNRAPTIVFYLTGDIMGVLRQRGFLAPS
jgi:hypothetical protein